ncbi:MAG: alpha/beta hydrolase [Sporichthyaceae bacterium]
MVQILVPGNTYTRDYWSAPVGQGYVAQAVHAGYATLAIDRLGTGRSLHPPSNAMTLANDAGTLHTVVEALRSERLGPFARVVGIGHSLGSVVVHQNGGHYPNDFDGLVLTGFSHLVNVANAAGTVIPRYASPSGDPRLAARGLDPLYVTAQPGGRRAFYASDRVEPIVLAWDDEARDVGNAVELAALGGFQTPNLGRAIRGPVLVVNGGADAVVCGMAAADCTTTEKLRASERPWFGEAARLDAWVVPGLGHNVTLHRNAPSVGGAILSWLDMSVGSGAGRRGMALNDQPMHRTSSASVDPAGAAANGILELAGRPAAETYAGATSATPGLGDSRNPLPVANSLLRELGALPAKRYFVPKIRSPQSPRPGRM